MSSLPSEDELYATRSRLATLISDAYTIERDADPDAEDIRLVDVVERVLGGIDPAEYTEFLRVALIDSVDSYFNPSPVPGLMEFLAQFGGDN